MTPLRADDPLHPSPEEGRDLLRRELTSTEYQDDPVSRLLDWIQRSFDDAVSAAGRLSWLSLLLLFVCLLLLVIGVGWLVSRARAGTRLAVPEEAVLADRRVPADEYRRRAERARAEGRHGDAVVDGFRAVATRMVERGRLDDLPGATAHEVALRLEHDFPAHGDQVHAVAVLFDAVRYGDHPAVDADAGRALALDDALAVAR